MNTLILWRRAATLLAALLPWLSACHRDQPPKNCDTLATVRDLRGRNSCKWVFELDDGQLLAANSLAQTAGLPTPEYTPNDGQRVRIGYVVLRNGECATGMCEVGISVEITCFEELPSESTK